MTTIMSACRTVDKRWAIIIVVHTLLACKSEIDISSVLIIAHSKYKNVFLLKVAEQLQQMQNKSAK